MNKKIGIITINDNNNYGNRLQNYATQKILESKKLEVITIKNEYPIDEYNSIIEYFCKRLKMNLRKVIIKKNTKRVKEFKAFNKNINFSKKYFNKYQNFNDFFALCVGSDQVWNPNFGRLSSLDLIKFNTTAKKISFSASFGVSELSQENKNEVKKYISDFEHISVREEAGKKIIEDETSRKDVEVLIDPTMLLNAEEWDKVAKKPPQLKFSKYILNYFLGELSVERKDEIDRIAKENECEIINILDKNSPFYETGPSEFLYLEKNAFLICTDSFHSCVFAILYNRPFIVFDREDKEVKMNSRIETLINKFCLKNRKFEGKITKENLKYDYTEANEILEREREKSNRFLEKCLKDKLEIK